MDYFARHWIALSATPLHHRAGFPETEISRAAGTDRHTRDGPICPGGARRKGLFIPEQRGLRKGGPVREHQGPRSRNSRNLQHRVSSWFSDESLHLRILHLQVGPARRHAHLAVQSEGDRAADDRFQHRKDNHHLAFWWT